ncbi:MAG TPA: response regulator transcription factor [Bdellovibrionales bacterium]|nr:response regulator transcription factor [Bdellovibrionales bacterium]
MASNEKVLVVEDESEIRELIVSQLAREGYEIDEASSGEAALSKLKNNSYDLLVLDWMLPGVSGLEIARKSRGQYRGILMVTARSEPADIVAGLESGADDYVTKPFDLNVLKARVRALLRRPRPSQSAEPITIGELRIDPASYEVRCQGQAVSLTVSEFKLLLALARSRGSVLTREKLIQEVQGEGVSVIDRTVDTHVFGLRKKLGACSETIETIRGVGYRMSAGG